MINKFIKGALTNTAELIQAKIDLGRTRHAERVKKQRRNTRNYQLQHGGILEVEKARHMIKDRADEEEAKLRRKIKARERKQQQQFKAWFNATAKRARRMRLEGRLQPLYIYEAGRPVCRMRRS